MTLDVLHFIDAKGGNAEEIRESQRKRGLSVELVDEIIQMYGEWIKSTYTAQDSTHTPQAKTASAASGLRRK